MCACCCLRSKAPLPPLTQQPAMPTAAPAALAAAHVGVAMGGGVDAASDVAHVVLMGDQLHQVGPRTWQLPADFRSPPRGLPPVAFPSPPPFLPQIDSPDPSPPQVADAIQLSKRTLAKIQQNLVWAFGYNLVGIPLAAGALLPTMGIALTPSASGALMGLSSLAVMGNSLLLQMEGHAPSVVKVGPAAGAGGGGSTAVQAAAAPPGAAAAVQPRGWSGTPTSLEEA